MHIMHNTIYFKSAEPYYTKELSGVKSNTVRILSESDINVLLVIYGIQNVKRINIMNTDKTDFFTRELSDISIHYDNFIFSWRDNKYRLYKQKNYR
jgi:hypothetical protein